VLFWFFFVGGEYDLKMMMILMEDGKERKKKDRIEQFQMNLVKY